MRKQLALLLSFIVLFVTCAEAQEASREKQTGSDAGQLSGVWEAKRRFGPDVSGTLTLRQLGSEWVADIAGKTARTNLAGDKITFELADGQNRFIGKLAEDRAAIIGHWIQPPTLESGSQYASPVALAKSGANSWRGTVTPLESMMTLYLTVKAREDGSHGAFLRNPERNIGWTQQYRVDHIELEGDAVRLVAANSGAEKGRVLARGRYYASDKILSIYFPNRGGTFDFRHLEKNAVSDLYPRSHPAGNYTYAQPASFDDGWTTASLQDVGIQTERIEELIRLLINLPMDSVNAPELHGVLIARHGKLVLEEYFHGENREKPHDTRSAAKSLTSTLVGAGIHAGIPLQLNSPVYQVMNGGEFPADLEPRKRALAVEHLITMTSGLDCDDNDDNSPGREDYMTDESNEPDYYKFIMALNMIREPGEKAVYCSVNPHLLGGVLQRAAGKSLPVLFQELIAGPMQIKQYYMNLTPTGDAYMGGGVRLMLRDFLKLGQLYLNEGVWNGRRILTKDWTQRATSPLYKVKDYEPKPPATSLKYGYLWWVLEYPYNGRTIQTFYAGGNGGQVVLAIPELDVVVAFYGGNFNDAVMFESQRRYIPEYILPAIIPAR